MAAALKRELAVQVELVAGSGGIFEVKVDGRVVAAKRGVSFPDEGEIVAAVEEALGGTPASPAS